MRLANLSAYLTVTSLLSPSLPGLGDAPPNRRALLPYARKSRSGCHVVIKGRGVAEAFIQAPEVWGTEGWIHSGTNER